MRWSPLPWIWGLCLFAGALALSAGADAFLVLAKAGGDWVMGRDLHAWMPSERVAVLLGNSVLLSGLSALVSGGLALCCLLAVRSAARRWWVQILVAGWMATFCLGSAVHLLAWRVCWPPSLGEGWAGWVACAWVLGLRHAPLAAALLAVALAGMDRGELESAWVLGGPRAVWRVAGGRLVRLVTLVLGCIGALVFAESEVPPLLGIHVYAEEFISEMALDSASDGLARHALPFVVVAVMGGWALARLRPALPNGDRAVRLGWLPMLAMTSGFESTALDDRSARRWLVGWLAAVVAWGPVLLLGWGWWHATGRWPAGAGTALLHSLLLAAGASVLACVWSVGLAEMVGVSGGGRGGSWSGTHAMVGWVLPVLLLWPSAITALELIRWQGADHAGLRWLSGWLGDATPLLASHALRILPLTGWVLLVIRQAEAAGPRQQLQVLGVSAWSSWRHVLWPQWSPGLVVAFLLGICLSLAELTATVLTVPPGFETVILRLYNLMHYGDQRGVLALALTQSAIVVSLALLAWWVMDSSMARHWRRGEEC